MTHHFTLEEGSGRNELERTGKVEIKKVDFLAAGEMHEAITDILLTRERGLEKMKVNEPGRWKLKRQTF